MHLLRLAYKFLLYRLKSFRLHGVHSPFVFELYQNVILHSGQFTAYSILEEFRQRLLHTKKIIQVTDFGAGSKKQHSSAREINQITKISAKPPRYAQLLFRLVNFRQPAITLELGTSLGVSTAYLAMACQRSKVFTLEGCPNIADEAQNNFRNLKLSNIQVITGNIDQTLTHTIAALPQLDLVFFDGNHRYEPTMRYFNTCLTKHTANSIFVFDDIYWSAEMEKAWQEIIKHPAVTLSIDLFQFGLIFFRPHQPKQHFTLWY